MESRWKRHLPNIAICAAALPWVVLASGFVYAKFFVSDIRPTLAIWSPQTAVMMSVLVISFALGVLGVLVSAACLVVKVHRRRSAWALFAAALFVVLFV